MDTYEIKCIKCDGTYTQERGKGAKPINTSHLCDKCKEPVVKKTPIAWVDPEIKKEHIKKHKKA
jgi:NAD-dependent SIR2 family protein deacetylase